MFGCLGCKRMARAVCSFIDRSSRTGAVVGTFIGRLMAGGLAVRWGLHSCTTDLAQEKFRSNGTGEP